MNDCLLFPLILSYIRRGESHWWMKGSTPPQIAEIIIKLVKDMAAVSYYWYLSVLIMVNLVNFSILFFVLGTPFRRLVQSHQKCNSWNYHSPYQNGGGASVSCTVYCHHKGMDLHIKQTTLENHIEIGVAVEIKLFFFCLIVVAGISFALCAGPGSCWQAVFWALDGQRWTAETDGESHIIY